MRRYFYETKSDLPPEQLYRALADIRRWPEWDEGIEATSIDGPAETGTEFAVKPRGRAAVRLRVESMVEPYRFADVAYLPLARMRTEHSFIPTPEATLVRSTIEISGLLAAFWDRPLAKTYAEGAAAQTRRFLAFAAQWQESRQKQTAAPKKQPMPFYTIC